MIVSFSPKIPLTSATTHYDMITNLAENIKQNFKNLLLTNPGERVMMPAFGCGLGVFLFESSSRAAELEVQIQNTILDQVGQYLSYIVINDISVRNPLSAEGHIIENRLDVYISYSVPSLNLTDEIIITP
tara:strand:- start:2007 stop:2396 length:390 start_codon:yes stop_codon:yes gene_type:complete